MPTTNVQCVACGRSDQELPIITFRYQGTDYQICTRHLPVLIHDPARLAGQLPDADGLKPADHSD